jgi:hypothetical protein
MQNKKLQIDTECSAAGVLKVLHEAYCKLRLKLK